MSDQELNQPGRNQRDRAPGGWEGGYVDQTAGRIMVSFDLKEDVIQPIERLEDKVDELHRRMDISIKERTESDLKLDTAIQAHVIDDHLRWVRQRRTAEKWAVRGLAAFITVGVPTILQLMGRGF